MKAINHLVLAGHDLEAMRSHYAGLGFTVTPRGQHPFGTGNSLIQLNGSYLELLAVTAPQDIPEHRAGNFSFAAFNRDYLKHHEGFSMLVLDTPDARADGKAWGAAGLQTYEPFDFSRTAKLADGQEIVVSFSLAFVSHPAAPSLGLFACQHHTPEYFAQPRYLQHAGATAVADVWIVGDTAPDLAGSCTSSRVPRRSVRIRPSRRCKRASAQSCSTRPPAFAKAFGVAAAHPQDGPHLAAFTLACEGLDHEGLGHEGLGELADLPKVGNRHVLAPEKNFGTAIGFVTTNG